MKWYWPPRTCGNSVKRCWPTLVRDLTLCCLLTNVMPNCLVTCTLQGISLHHAMSAYGGMISDILTVWISDKPTFQQHWNDTSKHNPFTVLMNCLMFKAVTHVYGYMYSYNYEYKCLWSKEIDVKICLSSLWVSVLFPLHVFHTGKFVSVRSFSVAVNEIFVHMDTHLPHLVSIKMC